MRTRHNTVPYSLRRWMLLEALSAISLTRGIPATVVAVRAYFITFDRRSRTYLMSDGF